VRVAIVLFTRDLRLHDQPALACAAQSAHAVAPLFVFDPTLLGGFGAANRVSFLLSAVRDLRREVREQGGSLVLRVGDVVEETMRLALDVGADAVFLSEDVSSYARGRERRLRRACEQHRIELRTFAGVTVVEPGEIAPASRSHYELFTAYWRRWQAAPRRAVVAPPPSLRSPSGLRPGRLPVLEDLVPGARSVTLPRGGETEGRSRLRRWLARSLAGYGRLRDDLAADSTSRLSSYLHFGCLSPLEVVELAERRKDNDPFVRQLAWRDFYAQLLAANPELPRTDLRPRGDRWRDDEEALQAWKEGRTGIPIVDAGMRQLSREGWMHNRARLVTSSFLTKHLYLDWRLGAAHYFDLLVDGDVASNVGNWQWVAGTGTDTRPNRVFNPLRQARRFDPEGDYVRRHVPELANIDGAAVHEPWRLGRAKPRRYPDPIVEHAPAVSRFRRARQAKRPRDS
jgi:deoxyribodipyrimidine photo-lyase